MHPKHKFYTYKRVAKTGHAVNDFAPTKSYRYGCFPDSHIELIWAEPDQPGNERTGKPPEEGYFYSQHRVDYILVYRQFISSNAVPRYLQARYVR